MHRQFLSSSVVPQFLLSVRGTGHKGDSSVLSHLVPGSTEEETGHTKQTSGVSSVSEAKKP